MSQFPNSDYPEEPLPDESGPGRPPADKRPYAKIRSHHWLHKKNVT